MPGKKRKKEELSDGSEEDSTTIDWATEYLKKDKDLISALKDSKNLSVQNVILEQQLISFNELLKLIETMTTIPPQYQYITWRGKLIPASKNPLQSIKEGEELVVKHSFVDKWSNVVLCAGSIEKISGNDQLDEAQTVLDIIDLLKNTKFFLCYSQLCEKMLNTHENMKEYFGGDRTTMEAATRTYFYDKLKAKGILKDSFTFLVSFRNKVRGIHTGCIALVSHDGINETYFVKTHHMGPTKSSSKSASVPDLREVFCYILLKKIGLGPECHFYTTPLGMSKMTLYIATKSIPNMEHMENATPSSSNIINIIMEIHLASSILRLADVHARNCGYQNLKPVIFDFSVPPNDEGNYKMKLTDFSHMKPQCVDTLVNARQIGAMCELAQRIDENERMMIARNTLKEWKISDHIPDAIKQLVSLKEDIRSRGCIIEDTNDFNNYIEGVLHNICLIVKCYF